MRLELSGGRLVTEPGPGPRHGRVAGRVFSCLREQGEEAGLGLSFFDTAFVLAREPTTIRIPDVAFVSADRVPEQGLTDELWEMAPDLVVEVVSPSNTASELHRKALDYLDAGSRIVWIVDPSERTVTALRSRSEIRILEEGETLDGGEVLPALEVRGGDLFDEAIPTLDPESPSRG